MMITAGNACDTFPDLPVTHCNFSPSDHDLAINPRRFGQHEESEAARFHCQTIGGCATWGYAPREASENQFRGVEV